MCYKDLHLRFTMPDDYFLDSLPVFTQHENVELGENLALLGIEPVNSRFGIQSSSRRPQRPITNTLKSLFLS